MDKDSCEEIQKQPEKVKAIQAALMEQLTADIRKFDPEFESQYTPSVTCGSLMIQAVVGSYAKQV